MSELGSCLHFCEGYMCDVCVVPRVRAAVFDEAITYAIEEHRELFVDSMGFSRFFGFPGVFEA